MLKIKKASITWREEQEIIWSNQRFLLRTGTTSIHKNRLRTKNSS
jgi:hypothetical protein